MLVACCIRMTQCGYLFIKGRIGGWLEKIHGIIPFFFKPCLYKIFYQLRVATVAVYNNDLIKSIPRNFITGIFQGGPFPSFRECKITRAGFGFVLPAVKIIGKYYGV